MNKLLFLHGFLCFARTLNDLFWFGSFLVGDYLTISRSMHEVIHDRILSLVEASCPNTCLTLHQVTSPFAFFANSRCLAQVSTRASQRKPRGSARVNQRAKRRRMGKASRFELPAIAFFMFLICVECALRAQDFYESDKSFHCSKCFTFCINDLNAIPITCPLVATTSASLPWRRPIPEREETRENSELCWKAVDRRDAAESG